jgi:sugar phosphate isomerase/epimerase
MVVGLYAAICLAVVRVVVSANEGALEAELCEYTGTLPDRFNEARAPMPAISRREFFRKAATDAAVAGLLATSVVRLKANPLGLPIGSQTYPHRAMISEGNFAGLLKILADIGVQRIELCSALGYKDFASLSDGKQVRKILSDNGLQCESAHFSMRELRETQDKSIAWAKDIGMTQMITATLGAGNTPTMDDVKKAADEYNKIAEVAAKAGIQQGLHNEGFELSEVDGKRTYDILFDLLDPKLVKFQFQMSTISRGFVAHEYFTKYPGRFISMHLQDVDLNATPPPPPSAPAGEPARGGGGGRGRGRGMGTSVGKGSIDWVKTFQAAKVAGVKNYFVEQNMELTKESVAFLKTLKV